MKIVDITEAKKDNKPALRNPVAKFAGDFNKAQTFRDRTKYNRKDKHKRVDDSVDPAIAGDEEVHNLTDDVVDYTDGITAIRKYAEAHYDNGECWDYVVEAFDDEEIQEYLDRAEGDVSTALALIKDVLDVYAEREADAKNSVF
jgi:hypothetical protein